MVSTKYIRNHEHRGNHKELIMAKKKRKFSCEFSSRELIFLVISFVCIATLLFALGFKIGQGWQLSLSPALLGKDDKDRTKDVNPPGLTIMAKSEADRLKAEEEKAQEDLTFFEILPNKGKIKLEDIKPNVTPEYTSASQASMPDKADMAREKDREKERMAGKKQGTPQEVRLSTNPEDTIQLGAEKKYTIQVSSFKDKAQAQILEARLRKKGFPSKLVTVEIKDSGLWHRVRVGSYMDRKEAEKIAAQLRVQEYVPTFITFLYDN